MGFRGTAAFADALDSFSGTARFTRARKRARGCRIPRSEERHECKVWVGDQASGVVRSGTVSPSTGEPIGTAYLPVATATPGQRFEVEIRGSRLPAEVVETPFWKKGTHR